MITGMEDGGRNLQGLAACLNCDASKFGLHTSARQITKLIRS